MNKSKHQQLKSQAHHLKPVVTIGQKGLTDANLKELEICLEHHQLIKIKLVAEKAERLEMINKIITHVQAELVDHIGQMAIIYRPKAS